MFGKKSKSADIEIFTIYDSKTETYEVPSFAFNHHDLVRQVINMFQDPAQKNNRFLKNAEDYSIFRIGTYCKKTGSIETQNLEHVANMHDLRAVASRNQEDYSRPERAEMGIVPT